MTHLIESIESIYNSIPLGAKDYAKSVTIHIGTRDVDTEKVLYMIGGRVVSTMVGGKVRSKHDKKEIKWVRDGDEIHINIL